MNITLKRIRQRLSPQSFPDTAEELEKSDLFAVFGRYWNGGRSFVGRLRTKNETNLWHKAV